MVLLALAIPVLFASAIRAAGPQATAFASEGVEANRSVEVMSGLALQTSLGRLFAPRPLCYDVRLIRNYKASRWTQGTESLAETAIET